jgi:serine/threonine-protein kinase
MNHLEVSPLLKDRYRLLQPLATGGFSETYLAEDIRQGDRCVIKKMRVATDDPQIYQIAQERFERESIILKDLGQDNPQIPTFYDFFVDDGEFLLVQEWIEGQTLSQKLQTEGTFSIAAVQELLVSLLNVLSYIHNKKIIHRDIKPDNIILRKETNQPVLIDFGAVKEGVANTLLNARQKSTCSIVIGTPGFMPSEQAIGRPTYSSDLYSLGLTAIYLLTGKSPQDLPTSPDTGAILWQQSLPQLSTSTYQTVLDASPVLAQVLDRAIESHPRDRFSTAQEMLSALEGTAQPIPTTVSSPALVLQPTAAAVDPVPLKTRFWPLGRAASITAGSLMGGLMLLGLVLAKTQAPNGMQQTVTSPQSPKSPALATGATPGSQQNQAKAKAIQSPSAPVAQPQPVVASPQPVQSPAYPRPVAVVAQPSPVPIRPAPLPPPSPQPAKPSQPPQAIAQPSPTPGQRPQAPKVPIPVVPIKLRPPQAVSPSPIIPAKPSPEPAKQVRRPAKAAKVTSKRRVAEPAPAVPERVRERRQSAASEPRRESPRRQRLVRQTPSAPPPQPALPPRRVQAPPPEVQPPPTYEPEVRERRRQEASDSDNGSKRRRKRD